MSLSHARMIVARLEAAGEAFEEASGCAWLQQLERTYGSRLPEPFRSLVEHFRWAEFDVGALFVFSNLGVASGYDLLKAPFSDKALSGWLLPRGFLQFGRLGSSYDPVCFDLSSETAKSIVSVDHEDILLCRRTVSVRPVAESFDSIVLAGAT